MSTRIDLVLNRLIPSTVTAKNVKIMLIFCLVAFSSLLFYSCAPHAVPLSNTLDFEKLPDERATKRIVVLIDKETTEMSPKYKPFALADSFQIDIGKSIKSNVLHLAQLTFTNVEFYNNIDEVKSPFDNLLQVKLIEFNFVMGRTVFSKHKCFLKLDYHFFDSNKQPLFTVNSMSSGEGKATDAEVGKQIGLGGGGQVGFKLPMGRAADIAIKDSLNQFLIQLNEYLEQSS